MVIKIKYFFILGKTSIKKNHHIKFGFKAIAEGLS
jgi:hypothetical protein